MGKPAIKNPSSNLSSVISGLGKFVPENVFSSVQIEDKACLNEKLKIPKGVIEMFTGIAERRYANDSFTSSDLAVEASKIAMERAKVKPEDIDMLIFASASHDIAEPATANIVQDKLKALNAEAFDVKNACNSFINGLDVLDSFIKLGRCRIGLVATGEILSRFIKYDINEYEDLEHDFAGLTLGDGGAAAVVKASEENGKGIIASRFISDGTSWDLATIKGGGTLYPRDFSQSYFRSHSLKIDAVARKYVPIAIKEALEMSNWKQEEVDVIVPHQVSKHIIQEICDLSGFPLEKCMLTLIKYGNTAAASMPIALVEAVETGRAKEGSKVLMVGGASGFSAGVLAIVL